MTRRIEIGWDKPLTVDWDFALPMLREEIAKAAPGGTSGQLGRDLLKPSSAVINRDNTVITITDAPPNPSAPYALIQDVGGPRQTRDIYPKRAKALKFWYMGVLMFRKKVTQKAGQILGSHFVEIGVGNWLRRLQGKGVVEWSSKHHSVGVRRGRGISST